MSLGSSVFLPYAHAERAWDSNFKQGLPTEAGLTPSRLRAAIPALSMFFAALPSGLFQPAPALATPCSVFQPQIVVDTAATAAQLAGREPTIYELNDLAFSVRNPFSDLDEFSKGKIANLAAPSPLHRPNVQRLEDEYVVGLCQFMRQLEKPVAAAVCNSALDAGHFPFCFSPIA